jgi:tetratricopeptide (TPR) repeat protein
MRIRFIILFLLFWLPWLNPAGGSQPPPPQTALDYYYLGKSLSQDGTYAEAIKNLETALSMQPNLGKADLMLGHCYIGLNNYEEALYHLRKSLRIGMDKQNMARAHHNLGVIYMKQGKREEAIAAFKEALKFDPNLKESQEALALIEGAFITFLHRLSSPQFFLDPDNIRIIIFFACFILLYISIFLRIIKKDFKT